MKSFIAGSSVFAVLAPRIVQAKPFNIFMVVPYDNESFEWVSCPNTKKYNCDCLVNNQETVLNINNKALGSDPYFQLASICGSPPLDFYISNYNTMHDVYIHGAWPPQLVTECTNEDEAHDCAAVSKSIINTLNCGEGVC